MTRTVIQADDIAAGAVDAGLASVQTFTSSGTWTRPASITKVIMEVLGAGGSGNSTTNITSTRRNGAAGGYAKKFLDVSSISTSTITVGAGGAANTNTNTGVSGGASSWADGTNTITCNGGEGGVYSAGVQAAGGTATGGDINVRGQDTGIWHEFNGAPASTIYGNGKIYSDDATQTGSGTQDATGYGAGGAAGTGSYASGAGSGGIIIVWEYK